MNTFDFFFGLNLGERLFSHTDNLSKTLQKTKMSAVSGRRVANVTKQVLEKMRNNECFKSFYDTMNQPYPDKDEHLAGLKLEQGLHHIQRHHKIITGAYTSKRLT